MGAGADTELVKLRDNDVRAYLELAVPIRQAATVLAVAETLGRNLLILKIKLSRRFDPGSGNPRLIDADPSNQVDKLNALLAGSKSPAFARYMKLIDAAQMALNDSTDTKAWLSTRIVDLMPGLEQDLADVCIFRSK